MLLAVAFALLASMFVAAGPAEARELRAAPDDGVAELTPDEWDCIINYEAEHVMICLMLKEKSSSRDAGVQAFAADAETRGPNKGGPKFLCPGGTFASPFEQPIYDDEGLFVVDYETVWYCLPNDLEPEG